MPNVIVGNALIVTVKATDEALVQPVVEFLTVMVPLYVPAAAAPGTVKVIGEEGNVAKATVAGKP